MSLEDKVYTWQEGYLDTGEFFKKEDIQESIKELKKAWDDWTTKDTMGGKFKPTYTSFLDEIEKIFGVRLSKQESKK